ncbi:MAG: cysteine hydrolase family protein [Actinomycetota bacterium]
MIDGAAPVGPLLVVIDMQRIFGDEDSPWATPGFDGLIEPIERLVRAFGDRVVFTRFRMPAEPEGSWAGYYRLWEFARRPDAERLLELAAPWTGAAARTVEKPTFSKWGPELRELAGESKTLVVCGVATDCCVIATVLGAVDDGMYVRVVKDACAGIDGLAHERAIGLMAGFPPHVTITTVEEELAARREPAVT